MSRTPSDVSLLWEPITIGGQALTNRVALAPMTRISAEEDGRPNDRMRRYYRSFARGGFGLLITEGTYPDLEHSQGYLHQPGLATDEHVHAWAPIVADVHEHGAKMFSQLMHAGAQSQGNRYVDGTVGPSQVAPLGPQLEFYRGSGPFPAPRPLDHTELRTIRRNFAAAAERAAAAGFDGVEIHGANGYLLDNFLTEYMNQRDDQYGGTTANRVRLLVETCDEVLQRVGGDIAVGIRISQSKVSDIHHRWGHASEDAATVFTALGQTGIDFVHTTEHRALAPAFPDESPTSLAQFAQNHSGLIVIVNGQLDAPEDAEEVLRSGAGDIVALGKAALADRNWPTVVRRGGQPERDLRSDVLAPLADVKDWEAPE